MTIRKKIVTDEQVRPVAVQIDYDDWLKIARYLELDEPQADTSDADTSDDFETLLEQTQGIWTKGDGLAFQRRLRAEWAAPGDAKEDDGA